MVGFNDMLTTHPEIAADWNGERNGVRGPASVKAHTTKALWRTCSQGHSRYESGHTRVKRGGCADCLSADGR